MIFFNTQKSTEFVEKSQEIKLMALDVMDKTCNYYFNTSRSTLYIKITLR